MAPETPLHTIDRQHFPVQQQPVNERARLHATEDRRLIAFLSCFGILGAIWFAIVSLTSRSLPTVSWFSVLLLLGASVLALWLGWRGATRAAGILLVSSL